MLRLIKIPVRRKRNEIVTQLWRVTLPGNPEPIKSPIVACYQFVN